MSMRAGTLDPVQLIYNQNCFIARRAYCVEVLKKSVFVMCMMYVRPAYTPRSVVFDLFSFSTVRKIDFSRCPGDWFYDPEF